jgi:hypothetical protein
MSKTAFLVGFIDTKAVPPRYKGCGIFSERGPTVAGFPFVIEEATGDDFASAKTTLLGYLDDPRMAWAKRSLKQRG